jgi:hypothetical protein
MIPRLKSLLSSCFSLPGDYIYFRPYTGENLMYLIDAARTQSKKTYCIESFVGLPAPTKKDLSLSSYYLHNKGAYAISKETLEAKITSTFPTYKNYILLENTQKIPEETQYCFAFVDQLFYEPTKETLAYLWDKMAYGGVIYIPWFENMHFATDLAVNEFIKEKGSDLFVSKQMIINVHRDKFLIIKCYNEKNKPVNWTKPISESDKKLVIAMVLKTADGGVYNADYVNALANGIRKNTTKNVEIVCLTNDPKGFNRNINRIIPLKHNYHSWWSKIELFRPDIFENERVFYLDLDTVIIDNIDEILDFEFDFCALRDFYKLVNIGSGLMTWNSKEVNKIYTQFVKNADFIKENYLEGDQQWIDQNKPKTVYFQDIFPKEIVSFKKDCLKNDNSIVIPNKAKIICFHGIPRPHTITDQIIKNYWQP